VARGGRKGGWAWRHAFDAAVPWYQILVSCSDWSNVFMLTNSRSCWKYRALSISRSYTIREKIFQNTDFEQAIQSNLCETFCLSLGFKNSKKYGCDLLQKEKEAFKILSFSYTLPCDKLRSNLWSDWLINRFQKAQHYNDAPTKNVIKPKYQLILIRKECMLRTAKPCAPRTHKLQLYGDSLSAVVSLLHGF